MSVTVDVVYEGIVLSQGVAPRREGRGVFVPLAAPMPVGTRLVLVETRDGAEHRAERASRVSRVKEGGAAGVVLVGDDGGALVIEGLVDQPAGEPALVVASQHARAAVAPPPGAPTASTANAPEAPAAPVLPEAPPIASSPPPDVSPSEPVVEMFAEPSMTPAIATPVYLPDGEPGARAAAGDAAHAGPTETGVAPPEIAPPEEESATASAEHSMATTTGTMNGSPAGEDRGDDRARKGRRRRGNKAR